MIRHKATLALVRLILVGLKTELLFYYHHEIPKLINLWLFKQQILLNQNKPNIICLTTLDSPLEIVFHTKLKLKIYTNEIIPMYIFPKRNLIICHVTKKKKNTETNP